ncbi:MAG: hypothetical protein JNL61_22305 [Rhizobiaceae bacterium]|nr:hypothetical protein [Rhizobiaceae bacterium]
METYSEPRSVFRSIFDACMASRRRDAERRLNGVLLMMDDATLKSHGYDRAALYARPSMASPL